MYELLDAKLSSVFKSMSESVAGAVGTIRLKPPSRAVVELDKQRQIVVSKSHPENDAFLVYCREMILADLALFTLWYAYFKLRII